MALAHKTAKRGLSCFHLVEQVSNTGDFGILKSNRHYLGHQQRMQRAKLLQAQRGTRQPRKEGLHQARVQGARNADKRVAVVNLRQCNAQQATESHLSKARNKCALSAVVAALRCLPLSSTSWQHASNARLHPSWSTPLAPGAFSLWSTTLSMVPSLWLRRGNSKTNCELCKRVPESQSLTTTHCAARQRPLLLVCCFARRRHHPTTASNEGLRGDLRPGGAVRLVERRLDREEGGCAEQGWGHNAAVLVPGAQPLRNRVAFTPSAWPTRRAWSPSQMYASWLCFVAVVTELVPAACAPACRLVCAGVVVVCGSTSDRK
jgi:hypothetical protein